MPEKYSIIEHLSCHIGDEGCSYRCVTAVDSEHTLMHKTCFVCVYEQLHPQIYRAIILLVVWCGCETWWLSLREECRLGVFENRVLRRIFGPKRDKVTGERRRLHNKELYALYSPHIFQMTTKSRRLSWAGHVAHMGQRRVANRVLLGKPEGKWPLGRPRHSWEDNIKMDL
jgi:hypothetical protein